MTTTTENSWKPDWLKPDSDKEPWRIREEFNELKSEDYEFARSIKRYDTLYDLHLDNICEFQAFKEYVWQFLDGLPEYCEKFMKDHCEGHAEIDEDRHVQMCRLIDLIGFKRV